MEAAIHLAMATDAARTGVHPWSWQEAGERDQEFAAAITDEGGAQAERYHADIADALQDVACRLEPLSRRFRQLLPPMVCSVTKGLRTGVTAFPPIVLE